MNQIFALKWLWPENVIIDILYENIPNKRALITEHVSILTFQSFEVLVKVSLILLSSSVTPLPLKILIFLTSSKAWINDSSSTAPAWPAEIKEKETLTWEKIHVWKQNGETLVQSYEYNLAITMSSSQYIIV